MITDYKIDEQTIVNWAYKKLPNVESFDKDIVVVYVNDFIGETEIIRQNRYINIELSNGESIYLDKKDKSHYYYIIFRKIKENHIWKWDLVGYDKKEIILINEDYGI